MADWRLIVDSPGLGYGGVLSPLGSTGGVLFPYTPQIQVSYTAQYDPGSLVHSNYKVHMYVASSVENIQVTGDFTAQDSDEAAYLMAVIHFFKSATKMFYGGSGAPPPLCFMTGMGTYQFNRSPIAVTSFNLNLPSDVDYIDGGGSMVPTKMQIAFSAIPIISRKKVSNEFNLQAYASGALIGAGFW